MINKLIFCCVHVACRRCVGIAGVCDCLAPFDDFIELTAMGSSSVVDDYLLSATEDSEEVCEHGGQHIAFVPSPLMQRQDSRRC